MPAKTRSKARSGASAAAACGCAGLLTPAARAAGHPQHAVGVDPSIREANLKHLRRIEGQIRGIAAMVEDDRYCADIINQVSAVRESLHAVARNLMRNHLKHCAAAAMSREGAGRDAMIDEVLDLVAKIAR